MLNDVSVEGCLRVATILGLIDRVASDSPSGKPLIVEETSPDSGHMQICHPSPCDGSFEAFVKLGDDVTVGDAMGSVVASDTGERVTVTAEKTGKLIVRRSLPIVRRRDSLGVILKTV